MKARIIFPKKSLAEFQKEYALVDMHVHSSYSHDCTAPIKSLVKKAQKIGIGFAVTDHLRAEGALEACRQAAQKKMLVIPGIEIASLENKEILLYFYSAKDLKDYYEKYIKGRLVVHKPTKSGIKKAIRAVRSRMSMKEIIEKADNYRCLKCIPHPYCYLNRSSNIFFARKKRAGMLKKIEAVEVLDSARRKFMNEKALKWAVKRNKAFTAGSDAHSVSELGAAVVASKARNVKGFLDSVKNHNNLVIGQETKFPTLFRILFKSLKTKRKKYKPKFDEEEF